VLKFSLVVTVFITNNLSWAQIICDKNSDNKAAESTVTRLQHLDGALQLMARSDVRQVMARICR